MYGSELTIFAAGERLVDVVAAFTDDFVMSWLTMYE
jgi:hypothetical protein